MTEIALNSHPQGHIDTFQDRNQVLARFRIKKTQGTPHVRLEIDEFNGLTKDQLSELVRRFRHLASATLVNQYSDTRFALKLNSGHPFIEGFLSELLAVLAGRRGWGDTFNPKLYGITIVDEHDNPIHEVIDMLARIRVWAVYVGNADSYEPTAEIARACNTDMTEENAIHAMELVGLVGDRLSYGGIRVEFDDREESESHRELYYGITGDHSFVLVEITDK